MKTQIKHNQQGFVSIIVAMFIMIFVTLLALGFAFLAQQNQEQNQNRTLSTQAFYAAESGVNDAVKYLTDYSNSNNGVLPGAKTDCSPINGLSGTIGSLNDQVKYTCVLYETEPTSLEYTVTNNNSTIVRVQAKNGIAIQSIRISWQDGQGSQSFASNAKHLLPEAAYVNDPANSANGDNLALSTDVLRATLIPIFGSITRADLQTKTQTLFLYPKGGGAASGGTIGFVSDTSLSNTGQGTFVDGNCVAPNASGPKYCNATITGLNVGLLASTTNTFYLRLRGYYRPSSSVTITAKLADGSDAQLINEQAVVDATGKANDVSRRIQVRVPLSANVNHPEFAIETIDSMCKRLQVLPGAASIAPLLDGTIPDACKAF